MGPDVRLDDKLAGEASEVGEIRPDRRLAAKFVTGETMVAQGAPKQRLGLGHGATPGPRELARRLPKWRLIHARKIARPLLRASGEGGRRSRPDGVGKVERDSGRDCATLV